MSAILNKMPSALTGSVDKVKSILFNKNFLIIMVVVAIFLGVAFYVYNTYIAPRINPEAVNTAKIMFVFHIPIKTKISPTKPDVPGSAALDKSKKTISTENFGIFVTIPP